MRRGLERAEAAFERAEREVVETEQRIERSEQQGLQELERQIVQLQGAEPEPQQHPDLLDLLAPNSPDSALSNTTELMWSPITPDSLEG